MTIFPEEEKLIEGVAEYARQVRGYDERRVQNNSRMLRHIFCQLSLNLVIGEVMGELPCYTDPASYQKRKNRIFFALVAEGEIARSAEKELMLSLDTLRDFTVWKREHEADLQTLAEVNE